MNNQLHTDTQYLSYLMRLWRTGSAEGQVWRVTLEEPLTQEMHRFDDLESLHAFLLAQTGQAQVAPGNFDLEPP